MGRTANKPISIPGIENDHMDLILKALKRFPEIEAAILFGSRAMGNYRPGSDIDLAIKGSQINQAICSELSGLLNEELPLAWYFDIIPFDTIKNSNLTDHINRVGIEIYTNTH
jgi:uncharacterized protein